MRLFLTGAGGLLGSEFRRRLPGLGHAFVARTHAELDITDAEAVARAVEDTRPYAVVNCAAFARLEACQRDPEAAYRINRDGAASVARAATAAGARAVHFSTDYVFDGRAGAPYAPDAARNPQGVYARSKADGEDAVRRAAPDALIVRVSWLYGGSPGTGVSRAAAHPAADPAGFVRWALDAARAGRPLTLVTDQLNRPSWAANVVDNVVALLQREAPAGVWHLTDGGETSRAGQVCEALRLAGLDAEIRETTRRAFWPDVPRPACSILDVSASEEFLGRPMEPWREALARYVAGE